METTARMIPPVARHQHSISFVLDALLRRLKGCQVLIQGSTIEVKAGGQLLVRLLFQNDMVWIHSPAPTETEKIVFFSTHPLAIMGLMGLIFAITPKLGFLILFKFFGYFFLPLISLVHYALKTKGKMQAARMAKKITRLLDELHYPNSLLV